MTDKPLPEIKARLEKAFAEAAAAVAEVGEATEGTPAARKFEKDVADARHVLGRIERTLLHALDDVRKEREPN